MQTRHEHNGITWIDLQSPTPHEVRAIMEEFPIPSLVAEELLLPSTKARIERYEGLIYMILHFPALRHTHKTTDQEIDFIVGENFIITTHYDTIDSLHEFSKVFQVNSVLGSESVVGKHGGFVLFYMLKRLYRSVEYEIDFIKRQMNDIENRIFSGEEKEMVEAISQTGRDLLNLRQIIEPHREVLKELEDVAVKIFGTYYAPYVRGLSNEYYRVHNHIMRGTEAMRELRETNNSLLSTKQNEIMKILTIMTSITAPLALITSLFGISSGYLPIVKNESGFWIIIAMMTAIAALLIFFFRYKRWF